MDVRSLRRKARRAGTLGNPRYGRHAEDLAEMGLPRLTGRVEEVCGFVVFLLTALLGFVGAAWWSIFAPILLLAALRYSNHVKFAMGRAVAWLVA